MSSTNQSEFDSSNGYSLDTVQEHLVVKIQRKGQHAKRFTTRKLAEGMEILKKPRGKRKSKLQLAIKMLRSSLSM